MFQIDGPDLLCLITSLLCFLVIVGTVWDQNRIEKKVIKIIKLKKNNKIQKIKK